MQECMTRWLVGRMHLLPQQTAMRQTHTHAHKHAKPMRQFFTDEAACWFISRCLCLSVVKDIPKANGAMKIEVAINFPQLNLSTDRS